MVLPDETLAGCLPVQAPEITRHRTHPGGIFANPTINLIGGAGGVLATGWRGHGETVTAPGYHHLDVLTAAARQSGGQPEIISTHLASFAPNASTDPDPAATAPPGRPITVS
ncbi:hypothetical protein LTT66_31985 [Nocardia gipuzkoensis]|uniref:hypothetical protein n=1 Tax=Nocardia gipuzkoensis TaxID=2749991 RepID=UPI001E2C50A2|nr:hypothetical protein [Nocardia gipuzkoensis]UGT67764.1 hypothetical protein LTT66_31985 [Nocardia gipuzkoensis]